MSKTHPYTHGPMNRDAVTTPSTSSCPTDPAQPIQRAAMDTQRLTDSNSSDAPVLPCPWCGAPVERLERGGYVRRFCPGTNHRNLYNSAMRGVALWYAELITTPGALQHWQETKACTPSQRRQRANLSPQVSLGPEVEDGRSRGL